MKMINVVVNTINEYNRTNKIQSIKKLREISKDFLGFPQGLREAKDAMDLLCIAIPATFRLEAGVNADVEGYINALNVAGFTATSPDVPFLDSFKNAVITAVTNGNYKFAAAMLQAAIKFGGTYGA
jgi:hypothetical protein